MNLERFKKSDRKQYEKGWKAFHNRMDSLMDHMQYLLEIPDDDITVDELHQLITRIEKLDKTIEKMIDVRSMKLRREIEEEEWE
jgi:hypothetical protein